MQISRKLLVLIVVLLTAFTVGACDEDESTGPDAGVDVEDVQQDDTDGVGEDDAAGIGDGEEVGAADIDENNDLVGQTVTVSADVGSVLVGTKAFTIGEDVVDNGVLVLVPQGTNVPQDLINEGTAVQVVGTVVEFTVADIEAMDEFGADFFAEDEEELVIDFEQRNALVAQSIQLAPIEDE